MPPRRSVRTVGAALAAVAALVAACTADRPGPPPVSTAGTSGASSPASSGVSRTATASQPPVVKAKFTDCTAQIAPSLPSGNGPRVTRLSFGCARVNVPVDYRRAAGASIPLYVVKVHDNNQSRRTGSLLVNPGGPGESGVQLALSLSLTVSDNVLDHFDLIGFDPRGVFLSDAVRCVSDGDKDRILAADPDVRTTAGLVQATRLAATVARACGTKYGDRLGRFTTEATARDMDVIRRSIGEKQLNYLGYSYGTRLGAAYAHLFPTTIRAMVLDGAVNPTESAATSADRQSAGFEAAFDRFAADCQKRAACQAIGRARPAVTALAARADRTPIRTSRSGDRRRATGAIVLGAVAASLYDRGRWPGLGNALLAAQRGDAKALFAITDAYNGRDNDGHYSNTYDAFTTITCNDTTRRLGAAQVQALARRWAGSYPLFGLNAAANLLTCQNWPAKGTPVPPATAPGSRPILVVGTVHDPATPYAAAPALARSLGSGVLLTWNGDGHTAFPKTPCITRAVESYLIELSVPAVATKCPLR